MSPATARFLLDLLNAQQLNVGAPDFDEAVGQVLAARQELLAVIGQPNGTVVEPVPSGI